MKSISRRRPSNRSIWSGLVSSYKAWKPCSRSRWCSNLRKAICVLHCWPSMSRGVSTLRRRKGTEEKSRIRAVRRIAASSSRSRTKASAPPACQSWAWTKSARWSQCCQPHRGRALRLSTSTRMTPSLQSQRAAATPTLYRTNPSWPHESKRHSNVRQM